MSWSQDFLKGSAIMMSVTAFKIMQFVILMVFAVLVSDTRKKKGMTPLISERLTLLLRVSYFLPLVAFVYILVTLNTVFPFDIFALALTLLGTIIVAKAKLDLSRHHTWTGYCLPASRFVFKGVYAYIRHPIYTGIYIFVLGGFFTVIPHASWQLSAALSVTALCSMAYAIAFLALLANKETKTLLHQYGLEFQKYKEKVHPFLPLRKYEMIDYV
jgi:protein-S-isoprenylcysteine O-methyltransferase Ste14